LKIESSTGEIVAPNTLKAVVDEGMPRHRQPYSKGRLFILFKVEFPKSLTEPQMKALGACLPGTDEPMPSAEAEETNMIDIDASQFGKVSASAEHGQAYDSDDEEGGQQRVQCQQS